MPIWSNEDTTNIFQLRAQVKLLKARHDIKVLVVDYTQLLEMRDEKGFSKISQTEEIAYISKMLKRLAKELNIWVFALAQFNRSANQKNEEGQKELDKSQIKGSSAIEQDSDVVLIIDMDEYVVGQPERDGYIKVDKNRESLSDIKIKLIYNGNYLLFREPKEVRKDERTKEMTFDHREEQQQERPVF